MSAPVVIPDSARTAFVAPEPRTRREAATVPLLTLALAAVLTAAAIEARGGLQLGPVAAVTVALDILAGLLCALAVLAAGGARRFWGQTTLVTFTALTLLTGVSITWAISPDVAWVETNRTLTWLLVFASGIALVRLAPQRWDAILNAVLIATVAISFYALLTKIIPASLAPDETYARLRKPFGYWNAVGLTAAIGIPIALWFGTRREGHAARQALAFPAIGLLVATMLLAYSRGAIVACLAGLAFWFAFTPLRLRGASVLIPSALGGALIGIWAFGQSGLSDDDVEMTLRTDAGTELGVLLAVIMLVLFAVGLLGIWVRERRIWTPRTRRAWGIGLLVAVALAPVALAGALALSERGLGGSVSKAWNDLTDPEANTPANDPSRLTAIGSVRARYWRDAIDIFEARTVKGVGAGGYAAARLRFRDDDLDVLHAHGYLVQTAADLGLLGLAISLALLAAWLHGLVRAGGPWRGRDPRATSAERAALLTMAAAVIVFGAHSLIDWTWFVPGTVVPALLLAGWIAARGPAGEAATSNGTLIGRARSGLRSPQRVAAAAAVLLVALTAAWSTTRPRASLNRVDEALAAFADRRADDGRALANEARDLDPLALEPLFALGEIEGSEGRPGHAREAYLTAVQLQPASAEAWVRLASFELEAGNTAAALRSVRPALYLDPRSPVAGALYLEAYRRDTRAKQRAAAAREQAAKAKAKKKRQKKKKKSKSK